MIDKRLLACADYVREQARFCDIGTDHAYLPCYLVKHQRVISAIAADIHQNPLKSAQHTIESMGLIGKIQLIQSDGLQQIPPEQADDIVIAGMGGELIAQIIEACSWVKDEKKRLILQPMTQLSFLRKRLYQLGYQILEETPVFENQRHYTVLLCQYTGQCKQIDELYSIVGEIPRNNTKEAIAFLCYQQKRKQKIVDGLKKSSQQQHNIQHYEFLVQQIEALIIKQKENQRE